MVLLGVGVGWMINDVRFNLLSVAAPNRHMPMGVTLSHCKVCPLGVVTLCLFIRHHFPHAKKLRKLCLVANG